MWWTCYYFSCKPKSYRYTCTAKNEDESEWKGPDESNDVVEGKLKEIGCQAEPWQPGQPEQIGRRFSCVNGGINAENKIPAENDCIMLCDNYPVFSFFTDFKSFGDDPVRSWFYELIDNPESKGELVKGMLDCWGKKWLCKNFNFFFCVFFVLCLVIKQFKRRWVHYFDPVSCEAWCTSPPEQSWEGSTSGRNSPLSLPSLKSLNKLLNYIYYWMEHL